MTRRDALVGIPLLAAAAAGLPATKFVARAPLEREVTHAAIGQHAMPTIVIRDIFRCKPGNSRQVAEMFKRTIPSMEAHDGFSNCRVLVDYVSTYWTVVLESEVDDLESFEEHMATFGSRPEVQEALAGYHDLVDSGHREIYRLA